MKNFENSVIYQRDLEEAIRSTLEIEKLKNNSILITGATGLIGSFIVDMFMRLNKIYETGITVYAMGRSYEKLKKRFDTVWSDKLIYVEHDIKNEILFDFPVDYIIHAAGNAYPAVFSSDPVGTIVGNIMGTQRLLEYGLNHGTKRFLFISSGEVYGQGGCDVACFEEKYSGYVDPIQPRSCYPASKRAAENLCISFMKQYGLDIIIARLCHSYGPNATSEDNRANVQFVNCAIQGKDIVLKSKATQMRSYCYVADSASGILTILLKGKTGEAYNVANPDSVVTIGEFARIVSRKSGQRVIFSKDCEKSVGEGTPINRQVLTSHKLENLGWRGKFGIEEGIEHTLSILEERKV